MVYGGLQNKLGVSYAKTERLCDRFGGDGSRRGWSHAAAGTGTGYLLPAEHDSPWLLSNRGNLLARLRERTSCEPQRFNVLRNIRPWFWPVVAQPARHTHE